MNIEGRLEFDLIREGGSVSQVNIRSSRPLQVARVIEGKTVAEALRILPLLYSVCGIAQACAASMACHQALGIEIQAASRLAQEMLVTIETAREHLLRVMIDWPVFLDEDSEPGQAAPLSQLLPRSRQALFTDSEAFCPSPLVQLRRDTLLEQIVRLEVMLENLVFGIPVAQWLENTQKTQLDTWIDRGGTTAARLLRWVRKRGWEARGATSVAFLPVLAEPGLHEQFDSADVTQFVAKPVWKSRPCETTPLSRMRKAPLIRSIITRHNNGLLARLVARLMELATFPGRLRSMLAVLESSNSVNHIENASSDTENGVGIGQVEAARGRLIHHVELKDGHIHRYHILAPTEWNFHPQGAVAQGFKTLDAEDKATLRQQAMLLINSVDPCVGYELRIY